MVGLAVKQNEEAPAIPIWCDAKETVVIFCSSSRQEVELIGPAVCIQDWLCDLLWPMSVP